MAPEPDKHTLPDDRGRYTNWLTRLATRENPRSNSRTSRRRRHEIDRDRELDILANLKTARLACLSALGVLAEGVGGGTAEIEAALKAIEEVIGALEVDQ